MRRVHVEPWVLGRDGVGALSTRSSLGGGALRGSRRGALDVSAQLPGRQGEQISDDPDRCGAPRESRRFALDVRAQFLGQRDVKAIRDSRRGALDVSGQRLARAPRAARGSGRPARVSATNAAREEADIALEAEVDHLHDGLHAR